MTELTVSALNQYIHAKFERDPYLENVTVVGELSGFNEQKKRDLNKAQYFTLKDNDSQISVISFRPDPVIFQEMEDGKRAIIKGTVATYTKLGRYQLIAHHIEVIDGMGQLYKQMLLNKAQLEKEGLFQFQRKPLVPFPRRLAVLTAKTGAVIHDIYKTVSERYPLTDIVLFPTSVQGENQTKSHLKQLERLKAQEQDFDAVIIGRGGGSFEDLFGYNDPDLIRSVAQLNIPVIVAVGHDTDHPLIEEVADYVASTPTQAAMIATPDKADLVQRLQNATHQMQYIVEQKYKQQRERLDQMMNSRVMQLPESIYANDEAYVEHMTHRLNDLIQNHYNQAYMRYQKSRQQMDFSAFLGKLNQYQLRIQNDEHVLFEVMQNQWKKRQQQLNDQTNQLVLLNPLSILKRGYTYTTQHHQAITSIHDLKQDEPLRLHFADGVVDVTINHIEENDKHE